MRSFRLPIVLAMLVVASGAPLVAHATSSTPSGTAIGASPSDVRVVKSIHDKKPWPAFCDVDVCGVVILAIIKVTVPAGMANPSVVVTETLDHRVTAGDSGLIEVVFGLDGGHRRHMGPGRFPLAPSDGPATTTASCAGIGLKAGRAYVFSFDVVPYDRTGDLKVTVTGTRATFEVSIAPGGTSLAA